MMISEAARVLGICPDTLRRLERRTPFVARRDWVGRRRYESEDLERLRELLFGKRGLPLTHTSQAPERTKPPSECRPSWREAHSRTTRRGKNDEG